MIKTNNRINRYCREKLEKNGKSSHVQSFVQVVVGIMLEVRTTQIVEQTQQIPHLQAQLITRLNESK